jgi:hypothetical protein
MKQAAKLSMCRGQALDALLDASFGDVSTRFEFEIAERRTPVKGQTR